MTRRSLIVLVAACGLATAAPKLKEKSADPHVGEWKLIGASNAGGEVKPKTANHRHTFTADGRWTCFDGNKTTVDQGGYTVNPKAAPATIDLHYEKDGTVDFEAIFKVEGDTLTVCFDAIGRERPKSFDPSPDKPNIIWVFQRVKPKE